MAAKSAMTSEILICWGHTASQLRQPMQADGHLSLEMADRAMGAINPLLPKADNFIFLKVYFKSSSFPERVLSPGCAGDEIGVYSYPVSVDFTVPQL